MADSTPRGTIFLIDDDDFILQVQAELLRSVGLEVRCFASPEAFLRAYVPTPRECILSDLRMPEISGLQLQEMLLARGLDTPLIFVTGHADVATAVEAMRRGAFDYVEKPVHGQHLLDRVNAALRLSGKRFAQRQARESREARLALLTPQERKIALWVADGKSSREIAEQALISVRTVENHRARIMHKLHANSLVEMVRLLF
jgi:FixJ family two-component response regulator